MKVKRKWIPYTMLLPAFMLVCIFKIYPVISSLMDGFTSHGHFSLEVYKSLLKDATFWNSLWVTIKFNLICIPLQICIAFILAMFANAKVKGIGIFRTIYYLPYAVSLTVATMIWSLMFNYNSGVLNSLLMKLGFSAQGFLNDSKQALFCIIIIATWKGCGYWMMFILAGLKNIDGEIYEAARIDGAGFFHTVFKITLPLLKKVLLFVCVANTSSNVLLFAPMQLITNGGPKNSTDVLMYEAYKSAFKYADRSRSAAIVSVLLAMIILVATLQFFLLGEREEKPKRKRKGR
ncbi:MAG: sugar ABC transporter permease [Lachnospiraceae bacterium]|nr:sugar ABC transporter permease [Lachnospiraceae bacterium]